MSAAMIVMVCNAVLTVVVPVGIMLFLHRRGGRWSSFAVGAATFVLFALVLEAIFHNLVLGSALGPVIQGNIWLYGLYGGLAAGIFEEAGRFLAFKLVLRKQRDRVTALSYGIGHGGVEAFLLLGMTMVNNLIILSAWTSGGELAPELESAAATLASYPASAFLWGGFERIPAIAFHMAASVLVFTAAARPGKLWLFPAAIVLHFLLDFLAVVCSAYLPIAVLELLVAAFAVAVVLLAARIYKNFPEKMENY